MLLDGKGTALKIRTELKTETAALLAVRGRAPGLAVILAGDDPASRIYVRNKRLACEEAGFRSETFEKPPSVSQKELEYLVDELNARTDIDGILLQLPLFAHLDSRPLLQRIDPAKDVDGFHPQNMGRLALGLPGPRPCTPAGVMALLRHYGLSPHGKRAVVVGRSNIVGKPLALMLGADAPEANATVTICHSRTPNLREECLRADFLFLALGRPKAVGADMVKEGAVVVDVGISRTERGLCGDCDFEAVLPKAGAITPVPGGVGPMTIAMLLVNTLNAYKASLPNP
ncbi:MAG: bifunctional methylenetetrahydrofolate dehydrogenase/methenyltetrahydrofolate cyclohydrolase FolD [Deltaproteobacteria bacterium]|nr:bifunctional methylenetetrahydrofolate dehydrogenase/methenyltetrahydrofolate cyclohydrolase FolD [Deltaproteobacteria bacterium]